METKVWHKVGEKEGTILALTGDSLYRIGFAGKDAKNEAARVAAALVAGQDPANLVGGQAIAVPLEKIERVEVSHGRDTVKFFIGEGNQVAYSVRTGDDGPGIAREVVERAKLAHGERSEDVGVVEALVAPVVLALIVGVVWALVYVVATEPPDDDQPIRGGRRGRGVKVLLTFVAQILGTNGTIAVGALALVFFVAWIVRRIVKRPQRLVWGPPAAA